jgi:hypothetical protein
MTWATVGFDRKMLKINNALQAVGFTRFPRSRCPFTFRQGARKSTIDYVFTRGLQIESEEVASVYMTNHRPLRVRFRDVASNPDLQLDPAFGRAYPRSKTSLDQLEKEVAHLKLMKVLIGAISNLFSLSSHLSCYTFFIALHLYVRLVICVDDSA